MTVTKGITLSELASSFAILIQARDSWSYVCSSRFRHPSISETTRRTLLRGQRAIAKFCSLANVLFNRIKVIGHEMKHQAFALAWVGTVWRWAARVRPPM